jgi:chlorobactene lauroyltransferase
MITSSKNRLIERILAGINRRMLRRHFHAVHLLGHHHCETLDRSVPMILYANHSCWWDGLIEFFLTHDVIGTDAFLMMEEEQLQRYRFFTRIGAFSVRHGTGRSLMDSITYASQLFERPNRMLCIYPQGELLPNDLRPLRFQSGITSILDRLPQAQLVPLAHRYEFAGEQKPEVFLSIGAPVHLYAGEQRIPIRRALEETLTHLLDDLRCAISSRTYNQHALCLLRGRASSNVRYDRARAWTGAA